MERQRIKGRTQAGINKDGDSDVDMYALAVVKNFCLKNHGP